MEKPREIIVHQSANRLEAHGKGRSDAAAGLHPPREISAILPGEEFHPLAHLRDTNGMEVTE